VIEAFAANGPDQALRVGVLPRGANGRDHFGDADYRRRRRPAVERGVAIVDGIVRRFVPGKRFTELLCRPRGRGIVGHSDVHHASTLMREDQQHEQESARCRRHNEEIGRRDLLDVIRHERAPRLRRRPVAPEHVLRASRLRHVEA